MPKTRARLATSLPMRPIPRTPRDLPWSSVPENDLRFHSPAFIEACAWGILRAIDKSIENVSSAVEMVFPAGVFITTTPRAVAGFDIDVVDTDARAADDFEAGGRFHDGPGDLRLGADDEGDRVADTGEQFGLREFLPDDVHLKFGALPVHPEVAGARTSVRFGPPRSGSAGRPPGPVRGHVEAA
jgi:hypothetical protein